MPTQFRNRLKMLRKERGVNQVELGKALNYGYAAISNYESGKNEPTLNDLCRIADFFDVSTDYFLGRTNDSRSHCCKNDYYNMLDGITLVEILELVEEYKMRGI